MTRCPPPTRDEAFKPKRDDHLSRRVKASVEPISRVCTRLTWWFLLSCLSALGDPESGIDPRDYRFSHLTADDGLSQNSVMCIFQDHRGFLWFGTQNGLNRFDGYEFGVWKHDPKRPNSLSDSWIHRIAEDHDGAIWVATRAGLNRLRPETGEVFQVRHHAGNRHGLTHDRIETVLVSQDDLVWAGTAGGGVCCFDANGERQTALRHDPNDATSLSHDYVWSLFEDAEGNIWIGTKAGGLNRWHPKSRTLKRIELGYDDRLAHADVSCITQDSASLMWVGTLGGGLIRLDPDSGATTVYATDSEEPYRLNDNRIWSVLEDDDGQILVGTNDGGLNLILPQAQRVVHFAKGEGARPGLNDNSVYAIAQDASGTLWLGTLNGGINKLKRTPFDRHLHTDKDNPNSLNNNNVRCISQDDRGFMWIGTRGGGLNRYDPIAHRFTHFTHDADDPTSVAANIIWAVLPSTSGMIWIGTSAGLDRLDPMTGRFDRGIGSHRVTDDVNCLMESRHGQLWIGTWGAGLRRYHVDEDRLIIYRHNQDDATGISHDKIYTIYEDRAGQLWVGSRGGLDLYRPGNDTFVNFSSDRGHPHGLSDNHVTCLMEDTPGNLWIGTWAGGLNLWRANDRQADRTVFIRFTDQDGIAADLIAGILADESGDIWISSNQGLYRYRPASDSFNHYGVSDGLQDDDFNPKACCAADSGELYFGGINGVTVFHPSRVVQRAFVPPVRITSFQLFNQEKAIPGLNDAPARITLDHSENYFSFEFAALDFASPEKNRYAYQMQGVDETWVFTDAQNRRATYTNLDPGRYFFRVTGSSSDGVWNREGSSVFVTIVPPIWQRSWFQLLAALAVVASLLGYFHLRTAKLRQQRAQLKRQVAEQTRQLNERKRELEEQNRQLQALNETKSEFLGIVVHDMRHPITAIIWLLNSFIRAIDKPDVNVEAWRENLDVVLEEARKLKTIVNSLLDISAIETGKLALNLQPEDFNELLKRVEARHRIKAQDKGIHLSCTHDDPSPLIPMDGGRIEEVLDNLLSNAVKYTHPGGSVDVAYEIIDGELVVRVADTGQGLSPRDLRDVFVKFRRLSAVPTGGETSTGYGLAIVKKIVDLHRGRVWVDSQLGQGATFSFSLPLPATGENSIKGPPQ